MLHVPDNEATLLEVLNDVTCTR